jgi:nucleoside-diphosphate-sugar epimerase
MNSALVTGASSFLGVNLVERLLGAGFAVHAIIRPATDRSRLNNMPKEVVLHEHDGTLESMSQAIAASKPQIVFHLAAKYLREHQPGDLDDLIDSNLRFGVQLLEAMVGAGVTRLVNAGSAFQHFETESVEAYRPLNLYAAIKQAFDDILVFYADAHGVQAVTLKMFEIYGPGDWRRKFMAVLCEAQKTGKSMALPADDSLQLDLAYVDDVIDAFIHAGQLLETDPAAVAGQSFAISSGRSHTLGEIISAFEAADGRPVKQAWGSYPTPDRVIRNPWHGRVLPGWRATIDLEEGVKRMLAAKNGE